ncbi:MAG: DUF5618 family protein [Chitinophagales bacterium]|nr:DUF5618 family protein [Chitinophagales bacterium]
MYMPSKSAYAEAYRYLENAEELLKEKAGRENGFYKDKKYVRMAGNTAWSGVLEAIEYWLKVKGVERQKKLRPDMEWYHAAISKHNKKLNSYFADAYNILHKYMGYDGVLNAKVISEGIKEAYKVIASCERDSSS